ncbi:MAG: DUF1573 domain-containing protein [Rikenellaceae bacterium]|jgi:hypothetical protein|nr:DUF1573 domain-containing protein [Rikenellaceae bacterium]
MTLARHILLTLTALTLLAGGPCAGQTLDFAHKTWDFGSIQETGGNVKHTFTFTNPGPGPVVIERVEVSCGCTTTYFSKKPVMAGKQGHITVTYDPLNRPGPFNKTAVVTANNRSLQVILSVTGNVIERVRPVEELFPTELTGSVRINLRSALFRNVFMGEARSVAVGFANTSAKAVKLGFEVNPACPYLKIAAPASLAAGARTDVTLTFDLTDQTRAWGVYSVKMWPVVDGVRVRIPINAIAYAVDDFGPSPDLDSAPRARLSWQYHDFGDVTGTQTASFELTNAGNQPLIIRYIRQDKALTCNLKAGDTIKSGEKRTVTVTLDPSALAPGIANENIMIICNDPLRPVREIRTAAYKK